MADAGCTRVSVGPDVPSSGAAGRHVVHADRNAIAAQCEITSYRAFKNGAKRGLYDSMHLMLVDELLSEEEGL